MTDRELLELAAKAAGIKYTGWSDKGDHWYEGISFNDENDCLQCWNPLTDDGDAMRLAVKLRMRIATPTSDADCAIAGIGDVRGVHIKKYSEDDITDIYEATRRAIVLAAAEIGAKL